MDVVFSHCAGLDVHKKSVTACRLVSDSTEQHPEGVAELRTFGTMTIELLALADWLVEAGVTHIAMESTGEYWKPVYNLLETSYAPHGARRRRGTGAVSCAYVLATPKVMLFSRVVCPFLFLGRLVRGALRRPRW